MTGLKMFTGKYFLLNAFTISLLAISLFFSLQITSSIHNDARMINMAGSLRYRAFEMVLDVRRLHDARDQAERQLIRNELLQRINRFERTLAVVKSSVSYDDLTWLAGKDTVRTFQQVEARWSHGVKPSLLAASQQDSGQLLHISVDDFVHRDIDSLVGNLEREAGKKEGYFKQLLNFMLVGAILVTFLFYRYVRNRVLQPVQLLNEAALQMTGGNLSHRVIVNDHSELRFLSGSFNSMADSLSQSFEELKRTNSELISLCDASNKLNTIGSSENIYNNICETAHSLFDLRMAWIGLIQPGSIHVEPIASSGDDTGYLANMKISWGDENIGRGPAGTAIRTQAPCCMDVDAEEFAPWSVEATKRGMRSFLGLPLLVGNHCLGVLVLCSAESGYFNDSRIQLCRIFANNAASVCENSQLVENMVFALARSSEVNDGATGAHIRRVGDFSALLAEEMGLDEAFVGTIRIQSTLHDVGKVHTPAALLGKPGRLTDEEYNVIKNHAIYGADIIGRHPWLDMARNIAVFHHERWDGSGYPFGLQQADIPLESRIVALADQYDALRSLRPYKQPLGHKEVCRIILEGDGRTEPTHFDPEVLEAFRRMHHRFGLLYDSYEDAGQLEVVKGKFVITPGLMTGIPEIDEQHIQIAELLNNLQASSTVWDPDDDNSEMIKFFHDYIEQHFQLEERFMSEYDYPFIQAHVASHQNFVSDFKIMKQRYYKNIFDDYIGEQIKFQLSRWLIDHIRNDDRALADYLKTFSFSDCHAGPFLQSAAAL